MVYWTEGEEEAVDQARAVVEVVMGMGVTVEVGVVAKGAEEVFVVHLLVR